MKLLQSTYIHTQVDTYLYSKQLYFFPVCVIFSQRGNKRHIHIMCALNKLHIENTNVYVPLFPTRKHTLLFFLEVQIKPKQKWVNMRRNGSTIGTELETITWLLGSMIVSLTLLSSRTFYNFIETSNCSRSLLLLFALLIYYNCGTRKSLIVSTYCIYFYNVLRVANLKRLKSNRKQTELHRNMNNP